MSLKFRSKFPMARIKKIMQADEEIGKVAQASPVAISKALELFLKLLVEQSLTQLGSSIRITPTTLKRAIEGNDQLDFLKSISETIKESKEPEGGEATPSKRPKRNTAKKSEHEELGDKNIESNSSINDSNPNSDVDNQTNSHTVDSSNSNNASKEDDIPEKNNSE